MILWLLAIVCILGMVRRVDLYTAFTEGARDGIQTAVHILPHLATALVAIHIMRDSGVLERIYNIIAPAMRIFGLPEGIAPLLVVRPISGSAALAVLTDILHQYGPDSRTGLMASTVMGAGETVFYTCALYLAAARAKKSRYIIPVSLVSWLIGCCVAGLFFR